jgi:hypothetical protein
VAPVKAFAAGHRGFISAVLTTVLALLVYLFTLEPDLTWANFGGDGGELITAAVTLGIPHPPGYPTYTLLGKFTSWLPVGTVAYRFNLLSALGTAVAAGFVTAMVVGLLARSSSGGQAGIHKMVAGISSGLSFAFGSLVWGQAVIAEVYGVNLAFVAAFLYLLLSDYNGTKERPWRRILAGALLGLSITMHLTGLLLIPIALALTARRDWPRLLLGLVAGLGPFLMLPILARGNSPVIWGQAERLDGWWWLVSAQLYQPNVFGLPPSEWAARLGEWIGPFLAQFAYLGLVLPVLGFSNHFKEFPRLLTAVVATALLYIVYTFIYNTGDAAVLLLPALLLLSVVLGFGLDYLGKASLVLPFVLLWLNLGQSANGYYVNHIPPIRPAAEALFNEVPPGAILLTSGDPTIAALWYFHHVEGKRPDITVVDGNLFQFDWYRAQLGRDYPFLEHLAEDDIAGFMAINGQFRPICETSLVEPGYLRC